MHTSLGLLAWYGDRGLVWTHWCTQAVLVYTNPFFTLVYIGGIGAYKVFPPLLVYRYVYTEAVADSTTAPVYSILTVSDNMGKVFDFIFMQ